MKAAIERKEFKGKLYLIPVRQIRANTNPRNPLSRELQELGFGVFQSEEGKPALWHLATSDELSERTEYVNLIRDHDPEIAAMAANILALGQLQAVEVRDNGRDSYTLVFGCRRCLAVLFNWCVLGKPPEPVVRAQMERGNELTLMHRAISENIRKDPNPIEVAQAMKYALNNGEEKDDLVRQYGMSKETLRRHLKLLELPRETQVKVAAGKLSVQKALQPLLENGDGSPGDHPKRRGRKEIEKAMNEFNEDTPQGRTLAWVLGRRDDL